MATEINTGTAQGIVDAVSEATFKSLEGQGQINIEMFEAAEKKVLLKMGYQPSVYKRKMQALWDSKPWAFKAYEYMDEEDFN